MKKKIYLISALMMLLQFAEAQCFPNRHSTNFFDGWISCEPAKSPNPLRPAGHFIMYDFGKVYQLGQMQIWNTNDPAHLDWGMRDVAIDYSSDGEVWIHAGDFTFPQASGLSTYEGEAGPYLNNIEGRFLLITGLNNYGGTCYGLSEMKVSAEEVIISAVDEVATLDCVEVTLYPNPFSEKMTISLVPGCNGNLRYALYDGLGHSLQNEIISLTPEQNKTIEIGRDLAPGTYMLRIEFGNKSIQKSIVKMSRT
ncbi:MAG TPA: T9SS type A sorting domain-containing protein [Saprospiraceae bacterium]|nr:T9SS type A sorting domain-containing protein [Saprospiraceae bacterium]